MPSCMRAPPDDVQEHHREALVRGALEEARDLLARDAPHRPAHEREEEGAPRDGNAADARAADLDGLPGLRRPLRRRDALGVGLAVDELERIGRLEVRVPLLDRAVVGEELPPARRRRACGAAPQVGQTSWFCVSASAASVSPHPSHLRKTPLPSVFFSAASLSGGFLSGHCIAGCAGA